jgi:hypothetical protein
MSAGDVHRREAASPAAIIVADLGQRGGGAAEGNARPAPSLRAATTLAYTQIVPLRHRRVRRGRPPGGSSLLDIIPAVSSSLTQLHTRSLCC